MRNARRPYAATSMPGDGPNDNSAKARGRGCRLARPSQRCRRSLPLMVEMGNVGGPSFEDAAEQTESWRRTRAVRRPR